MDVVNRYVVYELDYVMGNESCKLLKRVEFKGWLVSNCFNTEEDAIQALMSKVSELILLEKKETSAPQVNVTTDNKEVVAVFREIGKTINENLLAVKKCIDERPVYKEWEFKKSYTTGNSWDKIIATAKQ